MILTLAVNRNVRKQKLLHVMNGSQLERLFLWGPGVSWCHGNCATCSGDCTVVSCGHVSSLLCSVMSCDALSELLACHGWDGLEVSAICVTPGEFWCHTEGCVCLCPRGLGCKSLEGEHILLDGGCIWGDCAKLFFRGAVASSLLSKSSSRCPFRLWRRQEM